MVGQTSQLHLMNSSSCDRIKAKLSSCNSVTSPSMIMARSSTHGLSFRPLPEGAQTIRLPRHPEQVSQSSATDRKEDHVLKCRDV